ncbi:M56 family metallopeptidase [Rubripirellula amarantea]|nr:M56 family metallopeptidase [Rubripirellula amarantea]
MESFWQPWLFSNAAIALVIAVMAWLTHRVFERPAVAHFAWILVLVKLLTPPLQTIPLVVAISTPTWHERFTLATERPASTASSITLIALCIWVLGSVLMFVWILIGTRRVSRLLDYRGRYDHDATQLLAKVDVSATSVKGMVPQVWLVDAIISPMLYCPLRWNISSSAKIVFPKTLWQSLDESSRCVLLRHELAHWYRRDWLVRFLEMFAMVCLWWHPLVWIAKRQIENCEERCCDIAAVASTPKLRRTYAEAIMHTLDFLCKPLERDRSEVRTRPLASGVGRFPTMENRLRQIMKPSRQESLIDLSKCRIGYGRGIGLLLIVVLISPSLTWRFMRSPPFEDVNPAVLNASSEVDLDISPRFQSRQRTP